MMTQYRVETYNEGVGMIDFIIFGVTDNAVMILGCFSGYSIEKFLPKRFQVGLGMIFGGGIGNAISDLLGGLSAMNIELAVGTFIGCIIGLIFIPLFLFVGKLRRIAVNKINN